MGKYEELKDLPTISSERVVNENVIGSLKRFKIISDTYKNRRKRFDLRFNLIAGIYNYEIKFNSWKFTVYEYNARDDESERRKKSNINTEYLLSSIAFH